MTPAKIENFFLEVITNLQGIIKKIPAGKFVIEEFLPKSSIYETCPFLLGTLDSLPEKESILMEGMVIVSGKIEYNVDVELFKKANEFTILIHNRTSVYKIVNELNQGRNDLYFLKREIAAKNKELIHLRNIADKANEEKSRFLAMMSHEVRNPLNVILGYTELINKEKTSEQVKDYLKYLTISGKNLKVIVDDILDLSRVEAGKLLLANEPINLIEIINQIKNNYKSSHKDLAISLAFDYDKNIPKSVFGDDVRLIQILTNLINNSIKFTPKGAVKTTVEVTSIDDKNALISFKVKDTGRGMTKEQASNIFREYQQNRLSDSRVHKGAGLGLSIVKRLVSAMQGVVTVESEVNIGTIFSVEIPFQIDTNSEFRKEKTAGISKIKSLKGKNILVADDNYLNLTIVAHILKKEEAFYTLVKDGVEAIAAMDKHNFDIVLLDINMPNLKGDELIKRKEKMQKENSETPFLAQL